MFPYMIIQAVEQDSNNIETSTNTIGTTLETIKAFTHLYLGVILNQPTLDKSTRANPLEETQKPYTEAPNEALKLDHFAGDAINDNPTNLHKPSLVKVTASKNSTVESTQVISTVNDNMQIAADERGTRDNQTDKIDCHNTNVSKNENKTNAIACSCRTEENGALILKQHLKMNSVDAYAVETKYAVDENGNFCEISNAETITIVDRINQRHSKICDSSSTDFIKNVKQRKLTLANCDSLTNVDAYGSSNDTKSLTKVKLIDDSTADHKSALFPAREVESDIPILKETEENFAHERVVLVTSDNIIDRATVDKNQETIVSSLGTYKSTETCVTSNLITDITTEAVTSECHEQASIKIVAGLQDSHGNDIKNLDKIKHRTTEVYLPDVLLKCNAKTGANMHKQNITARHLNRKEPLSLKLKSRCHIAGEQEWKVEDHPLEKVMKLRRNRKQTKIKKSLSFLQLFNCAGSKSSDDRYDRFKM